MGEYKINPKGLDEFFNTFKEEIFPIINTQVNNKSGIEKLEQIVAKRRAEVQKNKVQREIAKNRKLIEQFLASEFNAIGVTESGSKPTTSPPVYAHIYSTSQFLSNVHSISDKKSTNDYSELVFNNNVKNDMLFLDKEEKLLQYA